MSRTRVSECKSSGKKRFRDRIAAEMVRMKIQKKKAHLRDSEPVRTYQCPECKGWHLTSKS